MEFALPTINVIFLLMLYFLSAGTLAQQQELSVPPPETTAVAGERLPRPLLVVSAEGTMVLDGRPVTADELGDAVLAATNDAGATELNLLVPRTMPGNDFLRLLAELDDLDVPVRLVTVERAAAESGDG